MSHGLDGYCRTCHLMLNLKGVPHPVRWSDTKNKFVAVFDQYCSWACAYVGVKDTRSDHLMGLLNFMFMHYSQNSYYEANQSLRNEIVPDPEKLAEFLTFCLPYTQTIELDEVMRLESIQGNKYLRSLYRNDKRKISTAHELERGKVMRTS